MNIKCVICLVILLNIVLSGVAIAEYNTVNVVASEDSYISDTNVLYNYGMSEFLETKKTDTQESRSLIKYGSLNSFIPENAEIISAKAFFYRFGSGYNADDIVAVEVIQPWNETDVVWNNRPNSAGYSIDEIPIPVDGVRWYTLNITSLAKSWYSGEKENNGIYLFSNRMVTAPLISQYWSNNYNNSDYRPYLSVTYSVDTITEESFMSQCISNDKVICDSGVLNKAGEGGVLKNIWWNLTIDERRDIGIALVGYINSDVLYGKYDIKQICVDDVNCTSPISHSWGMCRPNAIIRALRFGAPDKSFDRCGYINGKQEISSYYYNKSYGLPVYPVRIEGTVTAYTHSVVALQIGDDFSDFNSWLFFQYSNADIKPGDWQMPITTNVMLVNLFPGDLSYACDTPNDGNPLTWWDIDNLQTPTPTPTLTPSPTPTPTTSPIPTLNRGNSGGGPSGSGSGSPSEPYKNVNKSYKIEKYIYRDVITSYNFTKAGMPIYEIGIASEQNIPEVLIKIEELKNISTLTNASIIDGVSYYNIWISTFRFKNATIRFNCDVKKVMQWSTDGWKQLKIKDCIVKTDNLSTTFALSYDKKDSSYVLSAPEVKDTYKPVVTVKQDVVHEDKSIIRLIFSAISGIFGR